MSRRRPFRSKLRQEMIAFVALKQALGYKFISNERVLRNLDAFLLRRFPNARDVSVPMLQKWLSGNAPAWRAHKMTVARQFCLYRRRKHPDAFVPDRYRHGVLWPTRIPPFVPFIFSTSQVREVLREALVLPGVWRERPRMVFTAVLLLYTAGLRISEATGLRVGDVDVGNGTLRIRETKFFKTRLVPIAADVLDHVRVLMDAARRWQRRFGGGGDPPLFHHWGRPYNTASMGRLIRILFICCGLQRAGGGRPRVHDLRHTFAVHRLTRWYAEGVDVQSRLPLLATYMGHKDIASTQKYITVTGELLQLAGARFEHACAPRNRR